MDNVQSSTTHLISHQLAVHDGLNVAIMGLFEVLGHVIISLECSSRIYIHGSVFSIKGFCLHVFKVDVDLDVIDKL